MLATKSRQIADVTGTSHAPFLDRSIPEKDVRERQYEAFSRHTMTTLRRDLDIMRKESDYTPRQKPMVRHDLSERLVSELYRPAPTLNFTLEDGCRLIGTPYDYEWAIGGGVAVGARADGKFAIEGSEGESVAGVGFYVTSDTEAFGDVAPAGAYSFSCDVVTNSPNLRSIGGLGMSVFDKGPQPVDEIQVALWDIHGAGPGKGPAGSGPIKGAADVRGAGFPRAFGPALLRLRSFPMTPGKRFFVSVWGWQLNVNSGGARTLLSVRMPTVVFCGFPPPIVK